MALASYHLKLPDGRELLGKMDAYVANENYQATWEGDLSVLEREPPSFLSSSLMRAFVLDAHLRLGGEFTAINPELLRAE